MTVLAIQALSLPPLMHVDLELRQGVHVVVGRPEDGTAELIEATAGIATPKRGSVQVALKPPFLSPGTRRRIGSVLAREQLAPGKTLQRAVAMALRLRDDPRDAGMILGSFGLSSWLLRKSTELSSAECRSVALTLALSVAEPFLITIYEPFANLPGLDRSSTRERLVQAAAQGACVLCATGSLRDALELSDAPLMLQAGRLAGTAQLAAAAQWTPGLAVQLRVETPEPHRLGAELATETAVSACSWDRLRRPGELEVSGMDAEALALAVMRVARRQQLLISSVSVSLPSIESIQAAGTGWARAAYDAAYARAVTAVQPYYAPPSAPTETRSLPPLAPPVPGVPAGAHPPPDRSLPPIVETPPKDEDRQ
jgi:ABC-type taurine transport system ATPase subunit